MTRTIIPTKTIETVEMTPFRANLRRWEHVQGSLPTWVIEYWDGFYLVERREFPGVIEIDMPVLLKQMEADVAIMLTKRAFGLTAVPTHKHHKGAMHVVVDSYAGVTQYTPTNRRTA